MITANLTGYLGYNQELVFRNVKIARCLLVSFSSLKSVFAFFLSLCR